MNLVRAGAWVHVRVPAKINLFLEAAGRRPDGYHELVTVMQPIAIADRLACRKSKEVRVKGDLEELGEKNLIVKAVRAAQKRLGTRRGMEVRLRKRIPMGAGLGGGSADAAAAIAAFDALYRIGLDGAEMGGIGAAVGSDVNFFFNGRTALCTGRGEIVQPVRVGRVLHFVLVYPGFESSTAQVYRRLKLPLTPRRTDVKQFLEPLAEGNIDGIGRALFNRLETPAFENCPSLRDVKRGLMRFSFSGVLMSGSGSSFFGLCKSRAEARIRAAGLSKLGYAKVVATRSV